MEAEKFSPSVFNKYESDNIQILVKAEEKLRSGGYLLDQPGYDIHKVDTACKHSAVKKEQTDESSGHTFIVIDSDNIMHDDARIVDGKVGRLETGILKFRIFLFFQWEPERMEIL